MAHAGDGFFVTFHSPRDAADCAVEIQQVLGRHRKDSDFSPPMRIGFHAGEVLQANRGLVGREVHSAAGVAAAAEGDEVLVSEETARALADVYRFDEERHIDAKRLNDPIAAWTQLVATHSFEEREVRFGRDVRLSVMRCGYCGHPGIHAEVVSNGGRPDWCSQCSVCRRLRREQEPEGAPDEEETGSRPSS